MGINLILYLIEVVILVITLIIGIVLYIKKDRKKYFEFFTLSMVVFAVIFSITYIIERPDIEIGNTEIVEVKSEHEIKKAKAIYHFKDVTEKVNIIGDVNYEKIGEYNIKFELDTLIGKYSKDSIIKVVDTTAPVIELEGEENLNQTYSKEYEEIGYKAIDEYEGDLTDKVVVTKQDINENEYNIKYEVQDESGNKSEKIRHILIVDDIPPEISLNGNANMTIYLGNVYEEKGATAIDEKDGDLSTKIVTEGTVDTSKIGTYTITYKVSDSKGNETTKTRTVNVREKLVAQNASSGVSRPGTIYLTFDDGPSSSSTPRILDILKEKNVKATFFILNYDEAGEALVKREYAEGHTVAIHGYSHNYNTIYQSEEAYMSNLTRLQDKIKASTGYTSIITRFPGGSSNTTSRFNPGIMTRLTKLVLDRGFKYFDWNVSSGDAGGATNSTQVYNNVTRALNKSRANVVLMHDFSGNTKTINALADIIDFGIKNGYTFSRITEETAMVTHSPNN